MEKFKNKKFAIIYGMIILLSITIGIILSYFYNKDKIDVKQENRWDSNDNLIDDRLSKDYPIMFITSPSIQEDFVNITFMCIYNDGKYITSYYITKDINEYNELASSKTAFIEDLKNAYEENTNSEFANLVTTNIEPKKMREIYLNQYKISDFKLENTIDMSSVIETPIFIYGITYNDKLEGQTNLYYSENEYTTSTIKDLYGQLVAKNIMELE